MGSLDERGDGPLQMDAARAFDQNYVAGLKILEQPEAGGFGVGQKQRGDASGASGGG
jgi:hypothetical protein